MSDNKHGGAREGAGRPAGPPQALIRIAATPEEMIAILSATTPRERAEALLKLASERMEKPAMATTYYKRSIDASHGTQYVEVVGETIARQWLVASQGRYSGDGNPELVGQPKSKMRGYGFRKVSESESYRLLEESCNDA